MPLGNVILHRPHQQDEQPDGASQRSDAGWHDDRRRHDWRCNHKGNQASCLCTVWSAIQGEQRCGCTQCQRQAQGNRKQPERGMKRFTRLQRQIEKVLGAQFGKNHRRKTIEDGQPLRGAQQAVGRPRVQLASRDGMANTQYPLVGKYKSENFGYREDAFPGNHADVAA